MLTCLILASGLAPSPKEVKLCTTVEQTRFDQKVMGSNPAGCWVFHITFLLSMPLCSGVFIQVPSGGEILLIFFQFKHVLTCASNVH